MLPLWMSSRLLGFGVLLALFVATGSRVDLYGQMGGTASGVSSPATITGVVVNAISGAPVPRALVRVGGRAVLTDHDGKFEFDQFSGNGDAVQVSKPGFYASLDPADGGAQYFMVAQLTGPLRLRLYPEALLTGTISAPDGEALQGVPVSALRKVFEDDDERWVPTAMAVTNAHGGFRLPIPAGDYRLETRYLPRRFDGPDIVLPVSIPDGSSSNSSDVIRIRSGEEQHFDLHPAMGHTYVVSVAMEGGGESEFPRGFSRIGVRSAKGTSFPVNTMPGPAGEYRLNLPSGTYTLTATRNTPAGMEEAETNVTVADHDVSGVVLRFSPIPALPVEMAVDQAATSDNVKPPNLLSLGMRLVSNQPDMDRGSDIMSVPAQQRDGTMAFSVQPGSYRFEARNGGDWYIESATYGDLDLLRQDLVVVPGASGTPIRVVVSNQTGNLRGSVSLNGAAAECWIYLVSTTPSAKPVLILRSNRDGAFTAANLAPGSYEAVAFESRHSADYRDPASLASYASRARSIIIHAGDKATLDLEAVPVGEIAP